MKNLAELAACLGGGGGRKIRNRRILQADTEESSNDLDVSDDEELAQALDLHSLIASQLSPLDVPPQTADEVIEEIDEIFMQVRAFHPKDPRCR